MRARLEALVTLGGLSIDVDDGGGAGTGTIGAASYYPTALLVALQTALEAAQPGVSFTITKGFGAAGSGLVTITTDIAVSLDFGTTAAARLFGFASATSPMGTTHAATLAMLGVWLPDCPTSGPGLDFSLQGHLRTDAAYTIGPTGTVRVRVSNSYRSFRDIMWQRVTERRAIDFDDASSTMSWQQWARLTQLGGSDYFPISEGGTAPTVKIYSDADTNTVIGADTSGDGIYQLVLEPDQELAQPTEGWIGNWTVRISEIVKV